VQLDELEVDEIEGVERVANTSAPLGILMRFEDQRFGGGGVREVVLAKLVSRAS
jgi:hypothetical protein